MKDREISINELLFKLQIEYLGYKTRLLTYKKPFSEKYLDCCINKKNKIESLSKKIDARTVFNDNIVAKSYLYRFFNEWGIPNFKYKNKRCKDLMSGYDKLYYFARKTVVEVCLEGKTHKGVIVFNDINNEILKVKVNNKGVIDVDYTRARRMIDDNFKIDIPL